MNWRVLFYSLLKFYILGGYGGYLYWVYILILWSENFENYVLDIEGWIFLERKKFFLFKKSNF